jgi:hypothetical protein
MCQIGLSEELVARDSQTIQVAFGQLQEAVNIALDQVDVKGAEGAAT